MNFDLSKKLSDYLWIDGKMLAWDDAKIHVMTHSLHYAGAVFEGIRSYNGKIFKAIEHNKRLLKSAELVGLNIRYTPQEINQACYDVLEKNNISNAYIRPFAWHGADSIAAYNPDLSTHLAVLVKESNPEFKQNLRLILSPWRKIAENAIPVQSKSSAHYGMLSIVKGEAKRRGYYDALMLDQYDDIAECTTSNIFFARKHSRSGYEIVTPIADRFLDGITRQTIIEIARSLGMKIKETRLTLEDMEKYDSCFVTGTAIEIAGVSEIYYHNRKLKFTDSTLVEKLQAEYIKLTGKLTGENI